MSSCAVEFCILCTDQCAVGCAVGCAMIVVRSSCAAIRAYSASGTLWHIGQKGATATATPP